MKLETYFKHERRNGTQKDYTICGKVVAIPHVDEEGEYFTYELHIGVAVVHEDDTFIKKVGTKLALERATNDPILKIALTGDKSFLQFMNFVQFFTPSQALPTTHPYAKV